MVFMYLAIFLTIGILASGSDSNTSGTGFHAQALTVGVVVMTERAFQRTFHIFITVSYRQANAG